MSGRKLREQIHTFAPPWLRRFWGYRLLYVFALLFDAAWQWAVEGLRARMPGKAHSSALRLLGRDRIRFRGPQETKEAYALRLQTWLDDARILGNPIAIISQLQAFFSPLKPRIRTVSNRGTWFTIEPDGTIEYVRQAGNFDWDTNTDPWWRFWVVIYPNSTSPATFTTAGSWGDGATWGQGGGSFGTSLPIQQINSMRQIVDLTKPLGSFCDLIIAAFDNDTFSPDAAPGAPMPDGTWADYGVGDAPRIKAREPSARYLRGPT